MKGLGPTLLNNIFRKNRDKSGTQGAFRKKAPQQIRYSKGCYKHIRAESGTKKPGNYRIADKTQDTTCERCRPDNTGSSYYTGIFSHMILFSIKIVDESAKILDMLINC